MAFGRFVAKGRCLRAHHYFAEPWRGRDIRLLLHCQALILCNPEEQGGDKREIVRTDPRFQDGTMPILTTRLRSRDHSRGG